MGIYNQGLLGAFSGKVGPVVGSTWKNRNVLRARSRKVRAKESTSPLLIAQRARFSLTAKFLRSMSDLFTATLPEFTSSMTARNSATAMIIKEAVTGEYPNLELKYEAIKIARGSVGRVFSATAVSSVAGKLKFTWQDNTGIGTASLANDRAVLVAYCPEMEICIFSLTGGQRADAEGVLDVSFFSGKNVHTWIAFTNATNKKSSDSLYTGAVTVL
jgi:Family of unknown function (DUF6266)